MHRRLLRLLPLAWLALAIGCSPPAVAPANQELTVTLRTAISARNTEWLAKNAELIEQRHASGEMSDDEYHAFRAIVTKAEEGNWEGAERDVVRLQKAQRPTREQLERLPQRKPG